MSCLSPTFKAEKITGGNLSVAEKRQLLELLQKLDLFHQPIFQQHRDDSLEAVLERYFK